MAGSTHFCSKSQVNERLSHSHQEPSSLCRRNDHKGAQMILPIHKRRGLKDSAKQEKESGDLVRRVSCHNANIRIELNMLSMRKWSDKSSTLTLVIILLIRINGEDLSSAYKSRQNMINVELNTESCWIVPLNVGLLCWQNYQCLKECIDYNSLSASSVS